MAIVCELIIMVFLELFDMAGVNKVCWGAKVNSSRIV